ncbi:uncharacterized protein [Cherax quadricarinatus]|uniref:uncharacterized protein isoform X2 n=1 Tax=Cherax quadricarinatus TaxID=27406 RepID=UPI00387E882F
MWSSPVLLKVHHLTSTDQALYTCRVDFRLNPTKTTRVNLTVVVPPESVSVMMGGKDAPRGASSSVVGPYMEGDTPAITCVAHAGRPRPTVLWFQNTHLLDSHMESEVSENSVETFSRVGMTTLSPVPPTPPVYREGPFNVLTLATTTALATLGKKRFNTLTLARPTEAPAFGGEPYNTLTLGPLSRKHLKMLLTCEASNNNITLPISIAVTLDMNLPPLSVEIQPPKSLPLREGEQQEIVCVVVGARPPPTITWWSGYQRVLQATLTTSADGNMTTSSVVLTPRPEHNGSFLRCVAETHAAPASLDDTWYLVVHYVPRATCTYGASLDAANIKEGDDVYFECSIQANPAVIRVSWRHDEKVLVHNVSAGVIVSNQSLVLQRVTRTQAGRYTCLAHNTVGDGLSNSLTLDVKYAPVCSPGQVTTYAVERYEDAEVTCSVEANPIQESFQWTFNNTADTIDVPNGRFTSLVSHSVITYTPMTSFDYGTLLCWATNEIGEQKEPCVFHIVPAGKPEPPGNCTVGSRSRTSVRVQCVAGSSGGLPQHFLLQATSHAPHHQLNFTSDSSPDFHVEGLQVEAKYQLAVKAVNDKGASSATHFTISSIGTNGSVYQLHDGPLEAEVRDGKQSSVGSTGTGSDDDASSMVTLTLPSVIMGVLGAGSGLVFLMILLLLFITYHRRRVSHQPRPLADTLHHSEGGDSSKDTIRSVRCTHTSLALSAEHHLTCLERDMQQQAESESDAEPDVIPLQESYRSSSSCERELTAAATLLPSERYKYSPVPAHLPPNIPPCPPEYSVLGVVQAAPPLPCGDLVDPCYHHHHHHPTPSLHTATTTHHQHHIPPPLQTATTSQHQQHSPPPPQTTTTTHLQYSGQSQATTYEQHALPPPPPPHIVHHHHHDPHLLHQDDTHQHHDNSYLLHDDPHHHQDDAQAFLHQQAASGSVSQRALLRPDTTNTYCYTPVPNPHHYPRPNVEGSLPPPAEYLDSERKRVTFSRHASYEEDTPSTPLLKKGESAV